MQDPPRLILTVDTIMINASDHVRTRKNTWRMLFLNFLNALNAKWWVRVREKQRAQEIYTGSLNSELHPVGHNNHSWTLHYFKDLQSITYTYTFKNMQTHKILESPQESQSNTARTLLQA